MAPAPSMLRTAHLPTFVGLAIALIGPAVVFAPVHALLNRPEGPSAFLADQLVLWLLGAAVIAIVVWWERQPLSSIGLRWRWRSLPWGLALAGIMVLVLVPPLLKVLSAIDVTGFESGLAKLSGLPAGFLLFAAVTAGVVEETLYRGYAIERLAPLLGGYGWAGLVALSAHALVHLPMWGWGPVLVFFVTGTLVTLFYVWKRDLLACIIAHALTDAVGLVVAPALGGMS